VTRDRQQTEQHLIDAVGAVLVRDGMATLSVSSIAAEAGVDKALIYKYFKSLDHLFERYVETADLWWRAEELVAGLNHQPDNIGHSAVFRIILIRYLNALRRRPAALAILAGEINNINRLTEYLTAIREIETKRLMGLVATRFSVPAGGTEFSRFVIAINAMTYFILLSQKIRKPIYGIDLTKGEAGWARFEVLLLRAIENSTAPVMAEH
jgi:AcrR family transcriptional regulator